MTNNLINKIISIVQERFPVEKMSFNTLVMKKEVPLHQLSWAYYFGGLALFFFIIQVATGSFLLFYYEPTVSDAHASVEFITKFVPSGALIRNMHAWSSSLMILFVLCHLITSFGMKAFAKPRELTWLSGVLLLLIVFGLGFSGYLLPWNQIAVNATKVGLQTIEFVGDYLPAFLSDLPVKMREIIQGGPTVGQS
ncbi:MAG: cytochrome b N-terminal domain-containing protein, partial [Pseudomonadota bacterium]